MRAFEGNVVVVITRNYLHTCTWICKLTDVPTHTYTHAHIHTHTYTHAWVYFFVNALEMCVFDSFLNSNVCLDPQEKNVTLKWW
jgi:hypothetical protein